MGLFRKLETYLQADHEWARLGVEPTTPGRPDVAIPNYRAQPEGAKPWSSTSFGLAVKTGGTAQRKHHALEAGRAGGGRHHNGYAEQQGPGSG
jgi:hypothetical protein